MKIDNKNNNSGAGLGRVAAVRIVRRTRGVGGVRSWESGLASYVKGARAWSA